MVIAIISILLVFCSVSVRFLCAVSGEIKMFIFSVTSHAIHRITAIQFWAQAGR